MTCGTGVRCNDCKLNSIYFNFKEAAASQPVAALPECHLAHISASVCPIDIVVPTMATSATTSQCAPSLPEFNALPSSTFRISVITMAGAAIAIDDASAADTIRSVKQRVFAANRALHVRRQRLVYRPGPRGMEPLTDDETLGGAGVAQDGTAELDVLLAHFTEAEETQLGRAFCEAAKNGRADVMLALMSKGVEMEFRGGLGLTALQWAAAEGHTDCARLLLEAGADKDAKDTDGYTALILAAEQGRPTCVRLLLEAGADTEHTWIDGSTALIRAAQNGHTECVRLLVEGGADKEAKDNDGNSALIGAAQEGHTGCVCLLLEAGADKDAKSNDGSTALIVATMNGHIACVRLLVESGADQGVKDNQGLTALTFALVRGRPNIVALLKPIDADCQQISL
jgi:ankyrin repeat protein